MSIHDRPGVKSAEGSPNGKSSGQLIAEIFADASTLVRREIDLARQEITEIVREKATAAGLIAVGVVLGVLVLPFGLFTLYKVLDIWLAGWLAALIVTVFVAVFAAATFLAARRFLKSKFLPEKTIRSVKEDIEWAKDRKRP
jgi:hypothetical protein